MPPENTNPVAKTETSEFDFANPKAENHRIKKRSLKGKPASETAPAGQSAAAATTRPTPVPDQPKPAVYAQPASAAHEPRPTYVRPSTGAVTETAQPQPSGVLYYSNGPHKEASMKSTPISQAARPANSVSQPMPQRTATSAAASAAQAPINRSATTPAMSSPASAAASSGSSAVRQASSAGTVPASHTAPSTSRAVSTTVSGPSTASRAAGVSDYRSNIDRQAREQKSIGGILSFIVYGLIAFFVVGTALAAYGAHDVYRQLHSQSETVSDLDARYSAANQALNEQIKVTQQSVIQLQGQLARSQEFAARQQDALTKLQAALDAETAALREERATRAAETSIRESETSSLRSRVRALERSQITYRP